MPAARIGKVAKIKLIHLKSLLFLNLLMDKKRAMPIRDILEVVI
jgi:hypothetical protein